MGSRGRTDLQAPATTRRLAHEWRPVLERMARRCARHQVPARLGHGLQRVSGAPGAVAGGLQHSALRRGTNVRDLGGHGQPGSGPDLNGQVTTATPLRSSRAGQEGGPREPVVDARGAGVVNGLGADARRNRPDSRVLAWASDAGARRLCFRNAGRARAAPGVDDCAIQPNGRGQCPGAKRSPDGLAWRGLSRSWVDSHLFVFMRSRSYKSA